ncbi:MAG: anti-sigma factor domain-containing protein [Bacillota bacterium]
MMRENEQKHVCDLCLDYISGVCTDEESLTFEHHLPDCADCQAEIDELRIVWEALPENMERIEPPKDLKQQVMDAVLAVETGIDHSKSASRRLVIKRWRSFAAIAVVAAFFIIGSIWNYQLYHERSAAPLPLEQALNIPAAQIERLVSLKPETSEATRSYGVACIVDNGQSKQFIVYVFGAQATTDTQAYQVWLLQDGERRSAGTFRVDEQGIGVLAMPIASDSLSFDAVGITLEPDDRGDQPRGEKKFGSV